jgi:U4/U6 small nuclear ribonucleoprotein PRP3
LGILPPEQSKVKLSNMMRVLGDDAVQDPTMIEKRVKEEMASRVNAGLQHNLVNKLTDEERRAKKKGKAVEDESAGSTVVIFRYDLDIYGLGLNVWKIRGISSRSI